METEKMFQSPPSRTENGQAGAMHPLVMTNIYSCGNSPCYQWDNPLFLCPFSIAMLVITRR